jgi:hypothetical protein
MGLRDMVSAKAKNEWPRHAVEMPAATRPWIPPLTMTSATTMSISSRRTRAMASFPTRRSVAIDRKAGSPEITPCPRKGSKVPAVA